MYLATFDIVLELWRYYEIDPMEVWFEEETSKGAVKSQLHLYQRPREQKVWRFEYINNECRVVRGVAAIARSPDSGRCAIQRFIKKNWKFEGGEI